MVIQIIVSVLAALLVLKGVIDVLKKKARLAQSFVWVIFWALVVVAFWRPDATQYVANVLQVGRGADAVLYIGILAVCIALFKIYNKVERMDRNFTSLVRKIAIMEGKKRDE